MVYKKATDIKHKVALFFIVLLVCGCATTLSKNARPIIEADIQMVQNCKYLGDVNGSSGWGGLAASVGMENAKREALEKAAALGATHVVWVNIHGGFNPFVHGRAYKCVSED